jgi:ubiquinone/menaquinone biosynthesis C-methylase UbiE
MSFIRALQEKHWSKMETMGRYTLRAVRAVISQVPATRRLFWEPWYNNAAKQLGDADDFVFMNLGYANPDDTVASLGLEEVQNMHRLPQQLYAHVIGDTDIRGREVLEVGCGRGGGSAHIMRTFQPLRMSAVDLSQAAIECCRRVHQLPGLTFERGNAVDLPFENNRFDAVVNVESSHCYPSRAAFFREVYRVLKPGGHFLYTDVVYPDLDALNLQQVNEALRASGLVTLAATDIAKNVLKSRELVAASASFQQALRGWARGSKLNDSMMRWSFFLPGTESYQNLKDGTMQYWRWKLQKPASVPSP